jgi:hypothetical protein
MCFNFAMYEPMGGLSCGGGGMPSPGSEGRAHSPPRELAGTVTAPSRRAFVYL